MQLLEKTMHLARDANSDLGRWCDRFIRRSAERHAERAITGLTKRWIDDKPDPLFHRWDLSEADEDGSRIRTRVINVGEQYYKVPREDSPDEHKVLSGYDERKDLWSIEYAPAGKQRYSFLDEDWRASGVFFYSDSNIKEDLIDATQIALNDVADALVSEGGAMF